ncbi:MAG: amphi-Trp domain-containing protein [Candidatus Omnitrophota bacterium]
MKQEIKTMGFWTGEQMIAYLENLVKAYKSGKIVLEEDGKRIELQPPEQVAVEIKAKSSEQKGKFKLAFSWKSPDPSEIPEEPETVKSKHSV